MTNPDELRAALVAKLRAIPDLVTAVGGDSDAIVEYVEEEEGDWFSTIVSLESPCLIVACQGITPRTGMEYWQYNFSMVLMARWSPFAAFQAIVDGAMNETLIAGVHPMQLPSMTRRSIPVSEQSSFDYWEINTAFVEM